AGPLIAQPEKLEEFAEKIRKAQEQQDKMAGGIADQNDPNFYLVMVFDSRESREETLQALGLPDDRFVDGRTLRERLGLYVAGSPTG
ncbi:MAG: hypothetical protein KGR26_15360, partial [Cyanobacteria bacterium REEB65]|nr:hypothetical protein [Cyanobacteria bacterium REEB65]